MDCIVIEGLRVETVIGCFDWERQIRQPLLLDLTLYNDLRAAATSDQLEDTLNYASICELAAQTIKQASPKLIEHAAHLVLIALFKEFNTVQKIIITIRKPTIIASAQSVGIRLERQRNDICA